MPEVHLGAVTLDNLAANCGDFNVFRTWGLEYQPALLIGMDVLGTLNELTIDYRLNELQLLPHEQWHDSRLRCSSERYRAGGTGRPGRARALGSATWSSIR